MRRLYAGSVSYDATEEDIKEMFKPFGNITCLTISWDEEKNHHKVNTFSIQLLQLIQGFAFIEYDCAEAASLALQHLKGRDWQRTNCFETVGSVFPLLVSKQ